MALSIRGVRYPHACHDQFQAVEDEVKDLTAGVQDSLAPVELSRWGGAVGNIEDARVALDTLARAIEDAVYLDEDAYNEVAPVMQYQRTIQVLPVFENGP